ncbi:hypothetical protein EWM64_g10168 [Hericium alpestre]|uniref:BZIP domain-containing protein n=1 Tax=Hericium alpestre TaxID=135208 RepID=A0A4Y9ZHE1_9AGAM|nr:hypothetical protein EWM64_g10168 [Hericium alpestre]
MAQPTPPSASTPDRPERSRNAKAQARHRAKRKAYIEQATNSSATSSTYNEVRIRLSHCPRSGMLHAVQPSVRGPPHTIHDWNADAELFMFSGGRLQEKCGSGGVVTNSTTEQHKGKELQFTTVTCPALQSKDAARALEARQTTVNVCSKGGCTVDCVDTGEQPEWATAMTSLIIWSFCTEFLVDPAAFSYIKYDTCAFGLLNNDVIVDDVCYDTFALNSIIVADDCFGDWPAPTATAGGLCLTPNAEYDA